MGDLSANFSAAEFAARGANEADLVRGINFGPAEVPASLVPGLRKFAQTYLQPIRDAAGVPVYIVPIGRIGAGGYRTESLNRAIGGADDSRHLYDRGHYAADIIIGDWDADKTWFFLLDLIKRGVIPDGGLGYYGPGRKHTHIDNAKPRRWLGGGATEYPSPTSMAKFGASLTPVNVALVGAAVAVVAVIVVMVRRWSK